MNNPSRNLAALSIAAVAVLACGTKQPSQETSALSTKNWSLESRTHLFRHVLDRKVYYFAWGPGADMGNYLYDEHGNYVCDPNGGFAGQGDRKCPPRLHESFRGSRGVFVPNPFYKP